MGCHLRAGTWSVITPAPVSGASAPVAVNAMKKHATHGRRSARHLLLFGGPKKKRVWWTAAAVVLAAAVGLALVISLTDWDWDSVVRGSERLSATMEKLHPEAVIPLMAILPVFGFPIAIVYLVAGARFGIVLGGVIVAAVTLVHLAASYFIGRSFLRGPIERFIERRHRHLPQVPEDEQALVCVIAALIPGLPYFVRNYLLVLAGVRLRFLLMVCLPIYVARSYVTIFLGDLSGDPTQRGLLILIVVDVVKVAICALVIWRLREHHRKYHGHHDRAHDEPAPQTGGAK